VNFVYVCINTVSRAVPVGYSTYLCRVMMMMTESCSCLPILLDIFAYTLWIFYRSVLIAGYRLARSTARLPSSYLPR